MSKKIKIIDGNIIEYEIYKLVDSYDPILKKPTTPIDFETMSGKDIAYYSVSLMETLNVLQGLGLAANQVGLPYRMFALNMGEKIWSLINPVIVERSVIRSKFDEGCLSFPGLFLKVGRSESVTVEFYAANGKKLVQQFDGLTATCVQHEIDHLDGICFTSLVGEIKLQKAMEKSRLHKRKVKRFEKRQQLLSN